MQSDTQQVNTGTIANFERELSAHASQWLPVPDALAMYDAPDLAAALTKERGPDRGFWRVQTRYVGRRLEARVMDGPTGKAERGGFTPRTEPSDFEVARFDHDPGTVEQRLAAVEELVALHFRCANRSGGWQNRVADDAWQRMSNDAPVQQQVVELLQSARKINPANCP